MIEVLNPYREMEANITPKEFETFCMETLKAYALRENLQVLQLLKTKKLKPMTELIK